MQTPGVGYSATASTFSDSARRALSDPGLEFLLYGLQSPINIGMILRVAETYRFHVAIYDPFCLLDHPDKLRTISDFSCGGTVPTVVGLFSLLLAKFPSLPGRSGPRTAAVPRLLCE